MYILKFASIGFLYSWGVQKDSIVTAGAEFQQGMKSVSYFKKNTVTEIYSFIYAAAMVIYDLKGILLSLN